MGFPRVVEFLRFFTMGRPVGLARCPAPHLGHGKGHRGSLRRGRPRRAMSPEEGVERRGGASGGGGKSNSRGEEW